MPNMTTNCTKVLITENSQLRKSSSRGYIALLNSRNVKTENCLLASAKVGPVDQQ